MTEATLPTSYSGLALTVLSLGFGGVLLFQGCPDEGGDITPTPDVGSDDDDASVDDDDVGPNDDDIVIPEGIPIGGVLAYQPTDGSVPAGEVRGGLFVADLNTLAFGEEWHSDTIASAKVSLAAGQATFAYYVDEAPAEAVLSELLPGLRGAVFAPFSYVDGNASGGFNPGDTLLSGSSDWVAYLTAEDPDDIPDLMPGGGAGWNVLRDVLGTMNVEHHPEGVNSSQGLEMRVRLLPVTGGDVPVDADISFPDGSLVAAWHGSLSGLMEGAVPANPIQFVTPASNNLRDDLIDWPISGQPPADHVGSLDPNLLSSTVAVPTLTGAVYSEVGWVDDGDLIYTPEAVCDLLIAEGSKTLTWLASPGEDLALAFALGVAIEQRPGWLLIDTLPRRLSSGLDLQIVDGVGDDDDSGAPYGLPDACFGDDDDSADDDDSTAP
jgi:hypothetical protein